MKVWELEEGKEYESNIPNKESVKYKVVSGILYSIFEGMFNKDYTDYNYIKNYNFTEYTPPTDWSKVEVDTKVLVRNKGDRNWYKRHFAKYYNGKIYTWRNGLTSWSDVYPDYERTWDEVKLYTEE